MGDGMRTLGRQKLFAPRFKEDLVLVSNITVRVKSVFVQNFVANITSYVDSFVVQEAAADLASHSNF